MNLTKKEWDQFSELLDKIVMGEGGSGSWEEKADAIRTAMEKRDSLGNLEEFASWFVDGY